MNEHKPIDFVITWVDDSDPLWRAKRGKYSDSNSKSGNTVVRYRDWETLKYWFRGVEKFAPWVRYIFFVTDNQKPEWLNVNHPKLKWVKHTDYIPAEYLPTFNSHTIEWNLHRIEELSENFVYFNDDMYLIKEVQPRDFFVNDLPCDYPEVGPIYPMGFFEHILFNNVELLNRHFSLKEAIKINLSKWVKGKPFYDLLKLGLYGRKDFIPGVENWHIHVSFNKSGFQTLWDKEYDLIHATCKNRFRTKNDISCWCVRNWQMLSGHFHSKRVIGRAFSTAELSCSNAPIEYLRKQKGKVICLNDDEGENDFLLHKQMILEVFEELLPKKSSFEL